jgi:hypothetical protein
MMGERDYNHFISPFDYKDVVWETPENKPLSSLRPGLPGQRSREEEIRLL